MLDKKRTACFTGHRNIPTEHIEKIKRLLDETIEELYQMGVLFFGAGGAYGFDIMAEEAVLKAKEKHHEIKLILVLPCKDQCRYWSEQNKIQYKNLINKADKIVYTTETYCNGCMHKRNIHLVNYSGYCISYMNRFNGGTAFTVEYAKLKGLKVINLFDRI
ncbi:MAG: DUF1273 domain-containing protein [Ruminococcus sp.]|nr:DUF1273 domain-containing protein [Ruminococcus sp.]